MPDAWKRAGAERTRDKREREREREGEIVKAFVDWRSQAGRPTPGVQSTMLSGTISMFNFTEASVMGTFDPGRIGDFVGHRPL